MSILNPVTITLNGITHTIRKWAVELNLPEPTIRGRLNRGLQPCEILAPATGQSRWTHPKTITYDGRTQTVREWSVELDVPTATIYRRLSYGVTNPEALLCQDTLAAEGEGIEYNGEIRLTRELAEIAGISPSTLRGRLKYVSIEEALSPDYVKPPQPRKELFYGYFYTINGETLRISDWAKKLGITREGVCQRLQRHPPDVALDPEKWANREIKTNKGIKHGEGHGRIRRAYVERPSEYTITVGDDTLTIQQWADKLGISTNRMRKRFKDLTPEAAIAVKPHSNRLVEYNGEQRTFDELCMILKCTRSTIQRRLRLGLPLGMTHSRDTLIKPGVKPHRERPKPPEPNRGVLIPTKPQTKIFAQPSGTKDGVHLTIVLPDKTRIYAENEWSIVIYPDGRRIRVNAGINHPVNRLVDKCMTRKMKEMTNEQWYARQKLLRAHQ
jgi:DNA-binding transcriptional regulator YhcF (GntR family)